MPNMIILRGVSASGKSTFRKQMMQERGYRYVNNDELRLKYPDYKEHEILELSGMLARDYMYQGFDLIIDNTNINPRTVERWKTIGKEYRYNVEVKEFHISYTEACLRNRQRDNPVPESVIWKMMVDFGDKPVTTRKKAVIFDLDGTLCDISHRRHFVTGEGKKDWKGFYSGISGDIPNKAVDELYMMADQTGLIIIFVSDRPEDYRNVTEEWLNSQGYCYELLLMRPFNNKEDDTLIKANIYDKYIEPFFEVIFTVDDRPRVIRMWREKGLTCFDVGPGIEF